MGSPKEFRDDLETTLLEYLDVYNKGKKNIHNNLNKIKTLANDYDLGDILRIIPGNYEGSEVLQVVFGEDDVMGFHNLIKYDFQRGHNDEKTFRPKAIEAGDLRFFGYGGSPMGTDTWITHDLSEWNGDINSQQMNMVRMQALSAVVKPIVDHLNGNLEHFKQKAENGWLSPADLQIIEREFKERAKKDEEFKTDKFTGLETKFKENMDSIITGFQKDATFIKDKMLEAKSHIHLAHHPISGDLGYFDEQGMDTGGMLARSAILESGKDDSDKNYKGYTVGLYGHTHSNRVDVVKKHNGEYFFGISTKGLNYNDRDTNDKFGITDLPEHVKGEFAEIGLRDDKELDYVTVHKTEGDKIYGSHTQTREDLLKKKAFENKERVMAFNKLDYLDTGYFNKK